MRAAARLALALAMVPALCAAPAVAQEPAPAPAPAPPPAAVGPAAPTAAVAAAPVPEDPTPAGGPPMVAIDPGHGGRDVGAVGRVPAGTVTGLPPRGDGTRIYEKDVNLDVARRLQALLAARGYPTLMTRTIDKGAGDVPYRSERADLRRRVAIANRAGADLFVSIHANALTPRHHGTETFRFYATGTAGTLLARAVHEEVVFRLGLADRGVKRAGFYVLKYTAMPAVLLESGFLTNRDDVLMLASPDVRQRIAEGLGAGIDRYVREGGPAEAGETAAPEPVPIRFWVTAGVFRRAADARRRAAAVRAEGFEALVRRRASARLGRELYHVVTGRFSLLENAKDQRAELRRAGFPGRVGSAEPTAAPAG